MDYRLGNSFVAILNFLIFANYIVVIKDKSLSIKKKTLKNLSYRKIMLSTYSQMVQKNITCR